MRPGSGGPFDICSRLKGDEAAFAACRENIETCLEMDEDGEFDEGVESTFVLVDAGGRKFKPNSLHMCQAAAYLIGTTHEGKKNAPAAAGPQVKTIDRKSAPGSFEKNAIVVVGGDAKGAADVAKENPNSRVYFIDASFSDAASRRDAIRDVAFVLSMRMQDAASFVDGGRAALFRMDGGKFVSADPVQVRKQKTSSLPRQASIINIGKDTPPSKYKDGRIFFVGDLGRAKDRKALEDLAKKSSPQNVYLINTNH
ncbi:MAG TPA: hypothetical protein PLZ86_03865, partial [bacterium]|nr:hypothetical protein [bacterium]